MSQKFFAAEMEMDKKNGSRKPSREIKSEPKNPESPKSPKSEPSRKGRKSNRPRKIEIVSPEDTWEHSENTVVDQNSTGGKDYLIAEGIFFLYFRQFFASNERMNNII